MREFRNLRTGPVRVAAAAVEESFRVFFFVAPFSPATKFQGLGFRGFGLKVTV